MAAVPASLAREVRVNFVACMGDNGRLAAQACYVVGVVVGGSLSLCVSCIQLHRAASGAAGCNRFPCITHRHPVEPWIVRAAQAQRRLVAPALQTNIIIAVSHPIGVSNRGNTRWLFFGYKSVRDEE